MTSGSISSDSDSGNFKHESFTIKILRTCAIYFSTFGFGCGNTFLAPALLALTRQFQVDISEVSVVFTISTVSYLVSALLCGVLFNVANRTLVLAFVVALMGIPLALMPHVTSLQLFFVLGGLQGAGCGGYDVGQVAGILDIWRGKAAVFVLIQNLMYSLGTMVPPLLLSLYLPKDLQDDGLLPFDSIDDENLEFIPLPSPPTIAARSLVAPLSIAGGILQANSTVNFTTLDSTPSPTSFEVSSLAPIFSTVGGLLPSNTTNAPTLDYVSLSILPTSEAPSLVVPFSIAAGLLCVAVLIHLTLYFKLSDRESSSNFLQNNLPAPETSKKIQDDKEVLNNSRERQMGKWQRLYCGAAGCDRRTILLTFLCCAVIGPYRGMELTTMQFLPAFAVFSPAALSESVATSILFGMNGAYAMGRAIGILLVLKAKPEWILVGNFVLLFVGNMTLLFLGGESEMWMWIGSATIGAGLSTVIPAYWSYVERFFFVSHGVVSFVTTSDGVLASIYPLIVSAAVKKNPAVLPEVNFFSFSIVVVSFAAVYWVTRKQRRALNS